jgi:hypothetical protein
LLQLLLLPLRLHWLLVSTDHAVYNTAAAAAAAAAKCVLLHTASCFVVAGLRCTPATSPSHCPSSSVALQLCKYATGEGLVFSAATVVHCLTLLPLLSCAMCCCSYFIVAGLVFTPATVPYLRSEYGKEYDFDAPVSAVNRFGVRVQRKTVSP